MSTQNLKNTARSLAVGDKSLLADETIRQQTKDLTTPVLSDGTAPRPGKDGEQCAITGKPVADGIVMGSAVVIAALTDSLADGTDKDAATYTLADFRRAVRLTSEQLHEFQQRIREGIAEPISNIFDSHLAILDDAAFTGEMRRRIKGGTAVQVAIKEVTNKFVSVFSRSTSLGFSFSFHRQQ